MLESMCLSLLKESTITSQNKRRLQVPGILILKALQLETVSLTGNSIAPQPFSTWLTITVLLMMNSLMQWMPNVTWAITMPLMAAHLSLFYLMSATILCQDSNNLLATLTSTTFSANAGKLLVVLHRCIITLTKNLPQMQELTLKNHQWQLETILLSLTRTYPDKESPASN